MKHLIEQSARRRRYEVLFKSLSLLRRFHAVRPTAAAPVANSSKVAGSGTGSDSVNCKLKADRPKPPSEVEWARATKEYSPGDNKPLRTDTSGMAPPEVPITQPSPGGPSKIISVEPPPAELIVPLNW